MNWLDPPAGTLFGPARLYSFCNKTRQSVSFCLSLASRPYAAADMAIHEPELLDQRVADAATRAVARVLCLQV